MFGAVGHTLAVLYLQPGLPDDVVNSKDECSMDFQLVLWPPRATSDMGPVERGMIVSHQQCRTCLTDNHIAASQKTLGCRQKGQHSRRVQEQHVNTERFHAQLNRAMLKIQHLVSVCSFSRFRCNGENRRTDEDMSSSSSSTIGGDIFSSDPISG